jgi:hypothetical protein
MNPHRLIRLYPSAWRRRYEAEFLALLEDRPVRHRDVPDIVLGSIDAHLSTRLPSGGAGLFERFTGLTAISAGVALLGAVLLLTFVPSDVYLEGWGHASSIGGTLFYPLALFGSLGIQWRQARVRPNLAWPAWMALVLGGFMGSSSVTLSMWGGGIPASDFGPLQAIGLWVGSAVMGVAVLAIGVFRRLIGLTFILGSALAMIGPIAGESFSGYDLLAVLSRGGVAIYALGWIAAGISLQFAAPAPEDSASPPAQPPLAEW